MKQPKLYPYQEFSKNFIKENPKAGLFLEPGLGKAVDEETKIPTPRGFVAIKHLRKNDLVYNRYGQPVRIKEVYY